MTHRVIFYRQILLYVLYFYKMFTKCKKEIIMNNQEKDVLKYIFKEKSINQRMIAEATGHSLGTVN